MAFSYRATHNIELYLHLTIDLERCDEPSPLSFERKIFVFLYVLQGSGQGVFVARHFPGVDAKSHRDCNLDILCELRSFSTGSHWACQNVDYKYYFSLRGAQAE